MNTFVFYFIATLSSQWLVLASSHEIAMLAKERIFPGSVSNFLECPVEKAVRTTLTRASMEHGPRVTSRLLLAQRTRTHRTKMMTTKASLENNKTTTFDFRGKNSLRLSLIVAVRARGPRAIVRQTFLVKGFKSLCCCVSHEVKIFRLSKQLVVIPSEKRS